MRNPVIINMKLDGKIDNNFAKSNSWIATIKPKSYSIRNPIDNSVTLSVRKNQCEDHSICLDLYTLSTQTVVTKGGGVAMGQKREAIPGARIKIKLKNNLSEYGDDKEQNKIRETFNKIIAAYYRQGIGLLSNEKSKVKKANQF